jgi:hypothetical protein
MTECLTSEDILGVRGKYTFDGERTPFLASWSIRVDGCTSLLVIKCALLRLCGVLQGFAL